MTTEQPLISLIIPTYNRAHLIGETLNSIIAQVYTNWECIVVDDGSTDDTETLLESYCKKETRIKFYKRPLDRPKGANACRNYGLEVSKGTYINWFDSDDIMYPDFLQVKIMELLSHPQKDFVVGRGVNRYADGSKKELSVRNNRTKALNHNNFVLFEVFWITHDFLVKRSSIGSVRFDETLQSGQDYNFFVKVLAINNLKGVFVDKIVFDRRWHRESIQGQFNEGLDIYTNKGDDNYCRGLYQLYRNTYLDVNQHLNDKARLHIFRRIASRVFELRLRKLETPGIVEVYTLFRKEKGWLKMMGFKMSLFMAYHFGKGFNVMDWSRQ